MDDPVKRCPVRCPECGGTNIVAGDPSGYACDDCGKKLRLRDFRREAYQNMTPEQKAKHKADMAAFLDRFKPGAQ